MPPTNETLHISIGKSANYITSHLLNLQGLASTSNGNGCDPDQALCEPSVTHEITKSDSDCYATHSPSSSTSYHYVPRTLIVDGRDSFDENHGDVSSSLNSSVDVSSWDGPVSAWEPSPEESILFRQRQNTDSNREDFSHRDPLESFRHAASALGRYPQYSRLVSSTTSFNYGVDSDDRGRHAKCDLEDEDEEDYCYGQDNERVEHEKRRRLEKMDYGRHQIRDELHNRMEQAWEQAFYSEINQNSDVPTASEANNTLKEDKPTVVMESLSDNMASINSILKEREILWHHYFMPPLPLPSKYRIPLPFDYKFSSSSMTSSFMMGHHPESGGSVGGGAGMDGGLSQSWREQILSESLRKALEGCDEIKGFNIFVDGGEFGVVESLSGVGELSKNSKLSMNINPGGGLCAGLATSILEELHDECRSAGRWVVLVDPLSCGMKSDNSMAESTQVQQFRRRLNAGMALHGMSTNADTFLPLSVEGAHQALCNGTGSKPNNVSRNRILFEGSASIALALEASTLPYRLRHNFTPNSSKLPGERCRLAIQSGFYQGLGSNGVNDSNEPFSSASSLTYHEFLACIRSSSDKRRSILELDALLHPLSYPFVEHSNVLGSSTLASNVVSSYLTGAFTYGVGNNGDSEYLGRLHKLLMKGTSFETMRIEQSRNERLRRYSAAGHSGPGDWLEDSSMKSIGGEGLLSSLSGQTVPFGKRCDHHHFALSASLRPARSDATGIPHGQCDMTSYIRPIMESMGARYHPEVSTGIVVRDTVFDLTGSGSYWNSIFYRIGGGNVSAQTQGIPSSPKQIASRTPILSILGNSTRSYPRLHSISSGFVDSLHSRRNMGYFSRDILAGLAPEKDDCEEALEYCRELVDVYEPPSGSGLIYVDDENDLDAAFFDEK